jgi:hypothetical protein
MNLLCPNCQKMVTVDEQYAGQLMKCPLCAGTFTVPALPPMPTAGASTAQPPPPAGGYGFAPPEPAPAAPPRPGPASDAADKAPAPESPGKAPAAPPAGYTHTLTIWLSPRVLPWVAPVSLVLIFFLLFFNWDGIYPGGYSAYTQSGWQGVWAGFTKDPVGEKLMKLDEALHENIHVSWLIILYLLVFFPLLALAVAAALLPHLHQVKLPAAVQPFMPWRSAIVGGLALVAFLLLVLQLFSGLGLENAAISRVDTDLADARGNAKTPEEKDTFEMERGAALGALNLRRTVWLRLVVLFTLIAVVSAWLDFWLTRRGAKPLPRADLSW